MVSYSPLLSAPGTQQCPGATAFYNNTLYYIGTGHDPAIYVLSRTCDAKSLDPSKTDNEGTYWTQTKLQDEPNFQNFQDGCGTGVPPACAVAGDYLYFVWIQREGVHNLQVWATRLAPASGGSSMTWSAPVRLADADGPLVMPGVAQGGGSHVHVEATSVPSIPTTFAVTAWGDYLIACYRGKSEVSLLVYDTGDWPSQSTPSAWKASGQWSTSFAGWANFPAYADLGGQISMDWFTPGGAKPGTASAAPAIYLIISFFNAEKNQAYILHAMDLTPLDQWTGGRPFAQWQVENRPSTDYGVNVIRDPAGRMRAYSCDPTSNNAIWYITLATNQVSSDGYSWTKFSPDWTVLYGSAGQQLSDQAPVPAFVMGPSTTEGDQTVCQVYEFVLFHQTDHIRLVFSQFGKAVRVPDITLNFNEPVNPQDPSQGGALEPGEEPVLVVTGIVDSPLPMPAANLAGQSGNGTVGSVDYGTTETGTKTRSTSWSWSAGFISEGYATDGVGPAWDISFNAGMAGTTGRSQTTQIATTLISNTDAELTPQGNYFHGGIIFHRDEYIFYDLSLDGTTWTKASNAPTITSIWTTYTGLLNNSLQSYANTAGNLWSYTKAGWNARMQQLGYSGDNYFDEVITAQDKNGDYVNAVVFGDGASGSPFLEFAWSTSGAVIQQFNDVSTSFEESGWHMEASVYAGYSFAIGASIFGVGEKEFGELLVGGSYSRTTEEKTTEGNSWGITVDYGPPSPPSIPYPGQVTALGWKLYLLKANQQWTDELLAYGDPTLKDQIDPNSAPWRIVFEVDEDTVLFQGDNRNVVYGDQSGQIIEAWYYPGGQYSYGSLQQAQEGYWSWTNLTTEAVAFDGSDGALPGVAGAPYWFAWGLSQPGAMPYTQAVVFRDAAGDIYFLWSDSYDEGPGQQRPKIAWSWRNLAQTQGFVKAAGDPVGYHWAANPWPQGPSISVIYRGVDGDLHELWVWASQMDGEWQPSRTPTKSLPEQEKPASDPCALVWNEDPGGPSEHIYYRANNNQIYEMYYDRGTPAWTLTAVSALSHDHATPTGKPSAFVWDGGSAPSLHVGYRGSTGQIHELRREDNNWQPANDLSSDAHATAADQLAAEDPICGIAWERRAAPQTIHWYYLTSQGDVCELWRGAGDPNSWGWNNLSEKATGARASGKLPAVAAIVQGQVWYFDPAVGSSINLYLRAQDGAVYELRYVPGGPSSQTGVWQWTELTGWVTDAADNPLPTAGSPSG